jgi:hypothetical protein
MSLTNQYLKSQRKQQAQIDAQRKRELALRKQKELSAMTEDQKERVYRLEHQRISTLVNLCAMGWLD